MADVEKIAVGCIGVLFVGSLVLVGWCLLLAVPTWALWNWLMPDLFGLKAVTFWQALGLNFLTAILFKPVSASSSKSKD